MKKETFLLYISLIFLTCDTNLNRIENVLKNTNPKIQHLIKNAAAHGGKGERLGDGSCHLSSLVLLQPFASLLGKRLTFSFLCNYY